MARFAHSGRLSWFVLVVLCLPACSSGSQAKSGIELVRTIALPGVNYNALNGAGDVVAVSYTDASNAGATTGFRETLLLFKRDDLHPHDLRNLGSVYLGVDTLYHRVNDLQLTADWATVTINYNLGQGGWVSFVSLGGAAPILAATMPLSASLDGAVASGRWGVVSAGASVSLIDLMTPSAPLLVQTFSATGPVTSLMPVTDGFLAFTSTGYAHIIASAVSPAWIETVDPELRDFAKGYVDGTVAYVGGPSPFAGKARIAQLDLSNPGQPAIAMSADVEGLYTDFAYDGAGTYVLALQISISSNPSTEAYRQSGTTAVPSGTGTVMSSPSSKGMYARNGLLYVLWQGNIDLYGLP